MGALKEPVSRRSTVAADIVTATFAFGKMPIIG